MWNIFPHWSSNQSDVHPWKKYDLINVSYELYATQIFSPALRSLEEDANTLNTLSAVCSSCEQPGNANQQCVYCLQTTLNCAICRLPIRGLAFACVNCNHASHPIHIQQWFTTMDETDNGNHYPSCPWPGCNCQCAKHVEWLANRGVLNCLLALSFPSWLKSESLIVAGNISS